VYLDKYVQCLTEITRKVKENKFTPPTSFSHGFLALFECLAVTVRTLVH